MPVITPLPLWVCVSQPWVTLSRMFWCLFALSTALYILMCPSSMLMMENSPGDSHLAWWLVTSFSVSSLAPSLTLLVSYNLPMSYDRVSPNSTPKGLFLITTGLFGIQVNMFVLLSRENLGTVSPLSSFSMYLINPLKDSSNILKMMIKETPSRYFL